MARPFAPTRYAAVQWNRFLESNRHARRADISATLTAAELEMIKQYLIDHAADSDMPKAAGLR
ncbi:MAG: hypothetical protein GY868_01730 [Deltaproteobacteria bacterium]|nr:hypothetical protein [Deltaproteobacteria bacterium]